MSLKESSRTTVPLSKMFGNGFDSFKKAGLAWKTTNAQADHRRSEVQRWSSGQVELLLAEDRRQTCKELAERADISTETELRPAIRKKRRQLMENGVILLHDTTPVHVRRSLLDMLDAWDWEVLLHPRYSPDLSPCDFFLFPKRKNKLRGIRLVLLRRIRTQ